MGPSAVYPHHGRQGKASTNAGDHAVAAVLHDLDLPQDEVGDRVLPRVDTERTPLGVEEQNRLWAADMEMDMGRQSFRAHGEIRTLTAPFLRRPSLPVGLRARLVAPPTGIEPAYRGRQPRILTRGIREHGSELRESNPRLRFVGPRPSHWTKLGYRRWVLASRGLAYETKLRAGAAGIAPPSGFEPKSQRS